jgi:hypothetical protein
MNYIFLFCVILGFSPNSFAELNSQESNFKELFKAIGDLNRDGIDDEVIVKTECGTCVNWDKENPPQIITEVYLSDPKTRKLSLKDSSKSIACYGCGGVKGGKIVGTPSITSAGIFEMDYFGGSRITWSSKYKWRLNKSNDRLELVGMTSKYEDSHNKDQTKWKPEDQGFLTFKDVNFVTRKAILKVVNKRGIPKIQNCFLSKEIKIPDFSNFNFEEFEDGTDYCLQKNK